MKENGWKSFFKEMLGGLRWVLVFGSIWLVGEFVVGRETVDRWANHPLTLEILIYFSVIWVIIIGKFWESSDQQRKEEHQEMMRVLESLAETNERLASTLELSTLR
jgi:lysylphosphatidylglycerol synthetase-like protein (DUF2156 family)